MAAVLLFLGALMVVVGTAFLSVPAAVIVLGVESVVAGADLARRPPAP